MKAAAIPKISKPIGANINMSKHGAGPRVDGYMFVTDAVGMHVWLEAGLEIVRGLQRHRKENIFSG